MNNFTALFLSNFLGALQNRGGGDYYFYFSTLTPRVERLALRLLKDRYIGYQERIWYWIPLKPAI